MRTHKWLVETIRLPVRLTPHTGLSARREKIVVFGLAVALVLGTANLKVLQAQQPKSKAESGQQNAKVLVNDRSRSEKGSRAVPGHTLFPVASFEGERNRMGFIDARGRIVIPLRFYYVDNFSEGLAVIKLAEDGKEGFTDTSGNIVIQPQFDRAFPFMNGRAKVRIDGKWGFIDSSGEVVITAAFDEADNFSEGLAAIKLNGKWGYVDLAGKLAISPRFQRANRFSEGIASVTSSNQVGYIDKSGKWFLTPRFEALPSPTDALRVTNFNSARAVARKGDQYGFIDKTGAFIIPPYFDKADIFSEELASVTIQNKAGYINPQGTLVISLRFDAARQFSEGYAAVLAGNKWGYVDFSGRFAIEPQFDLVMSFKNGLARVWSGDYHGYIDKTGKYVWRAKWRISMKSSRAESPQAQLVPFTWRNGSNELGRMLVPSGYSEETKAYREGVVTTLSYPDGCYILLQAGGMIASPFFTEPEHQVLQSRRLPNLVVRTGRVRNTGLFWREENTTGGWPATNRAFTNVPKDRFSLFSDALGSFKKEKRTASAQTDPSKSHEVASQDPPSSEITFCKFDLPDYVKRAHASFYVNYMFEIDKEGRPVRLRKLSDEWVGDERVLACVANWRFRGIEEGTKMALFFRWEHGIGWVELSIAGGGFSHVIRNP